MAAAKPSSTGHNKAIATVLAAMSKRRFIFVVVLICACSNGAVLAASRISLEMVHDDFIRVIRGVMTKKVGISICTH